MTFTPIARASNVNFSYIDKYKKAYHEILKGKNTNIVPLDYAMDIMEANVNSYKYTSYQLAGQLGIEYKEDDENIFMFHDYLCDFDENNLNRYFTFWTKTYFAPNPYVKDDKGNSDKTLLYCSICERIIQSDNYSINYNDFWESNKYKGKGDILLNAIKSYASPIKYKESDNDKILYIDKDDIDKVKKEIKFIKENFPISDSKSKKDFFERYSYENFRKFYNYNNEDEGWFRMELPSKSVKKCAKQLVDYIYEIDAFKNLTGCFVNNDASIKIDTEFLGGNYLRAMFAKPESNLYQGSDDGKTRVFLDKEYYIEIDGGKSKCRLSTEWVGTDIPDSQQSANYLVALIRIVNEKYANKIKIIKRDEKWYLEYRKAFNFADLPKCFKDNYSKRYIKALISKPFVILTGNSGTGKTRIAKQFAEYLEIGFENNEKNWLLVPVGADWGDNTKILGYYNPLANDGKGKYEKTEILKLIERANLPQNQNIPFFLILDEMNLSHVERYFADFLSRMETPSLGFVLDGYDIDGASSVVKYPENLFIVGTVNIDETTYMFSPKVLDRANVIEFKPDKEDIFKLFVNKANDEIVAPATLSTVESFYDLARRIREGECGLKVSTLEDVKKSFESIYDIVEKSGYEFAYRSVCEIRQYLSAAYELADDKDSFKIADIIDEQLLQHILPKIHGNDKEIGGLLDELGKLCDENKWKLSDKKIEKMKGKLARNHYASFI